jgi:hypothetical protein
MNAIPAQKTIANDVAQALLAILGDVERLSERLSDSVKTIRRTIESIGGVGFCLPATCDKPDGQTRRKGNFQKIKEYLESLCGESASIPAIAKATGVPQASIRNMIYGTKRNQFEEVTAQGSTEKRWRLASASPGLFGNDWLDREILC